MEAIGTILALLCVMAFLAMLIGLIRPTLVIRWGEKRTRGRVLLYYGLGLIVLGILLPAKEPEEVKVERIEAPVAVETVETLDPVAMLRAEKDSIVKARLTDQELKEVWDTTRREIRNKLQDKKGITIGYFPELSRWKVERKGRVVRDSIILQYTLDYEIGYKYNNGSLKFTDVEVKLDHNTYNDTWSVERLHLPDFNNFYVDTPEGREEVKKALIQAFSKGVAETAPVLSISASGLYAEYESNHLRADAKYKEKVIEVSGIVRSTGRDKEGYPYILLDAENTIWGVQCFLGSYNHDDALKVSKGQRVKIKGQVMSKKVNVMMGFCQVR